MRIYTRARRTGRRRPGRDRRLDRHRIAASAASSACATPTATRTRTRHLAKVAALHPVPKPRAESEQAIRRELGLDGKDPKPTGSATAGKQTVTPQSSTQTLSTTAPAPAPAASGGALSTGLASPAITAQQPTATPGTLTSPSPAGGTTAAAPAASASPVEQTSTAALVRGLATTPDATLTAAADSSGRPPLYLRLRAYAKLAMAKIDAAAPTVDVSTFRAYFANRPAGLKRGDYVLKPMRRGAKVIAGTIIGRVGMASLRRTQGTGAGDRAAERKAAAHLHLTRVPHLYFEIRPAGRKSPRIDPKPILDGWRLLDETAIYRARQPRRRAARAVGQADDRPDPADEQGPARAPRAGQPEHQDLRVRTPGHPGRRHRPPRARDARVPRLARDEPDGHRAEVRPQPLHDERQHLRAQHR